MCNEGKIDRIVRVVLGLAIIGWGVAAQNWWGAVGLVPLLTGAVGICPLYIPFGIDTGCHKEKESENS
ncbi:YgaP family membrane protein [Hydrogenimonas sp.]